MNVLFQDHCPACHVNCGQVHRDGCDVEQCPYCGMQAISCDCAPRDPETFTGIASDDRLRWDGAWPGVREAVDFGWAAKFTSNGWMPCNISDPEAQPDLNRLIAEASWDPKRKQFVKKTRSQKACQS